MVDGMSDPYVWIPEDSQTWQAELQSEYLCRMKGCRRRAVAKRLRTNGWWRYCDRHLYGRRIVGATIQCRVAYGSPAHERFMDGKGRSMSAPSVNDSNPRFLHGCAKMEEDGEGWVVIVCDCGYALGQFPDYLTAVDALISHVVDRVAST